MLDLRHWGDDERPDDWPHYECDDCGCRYQAPEDERTSCPRCELQTLNAFRWTRKTLEGQTDDSIRNVAGPGRPLAVRAAEALVGGLSRLGVE